MQRQKPVAIKCETNNVVYQNVCSLFLPFVNSSVERVSLDQRYS